MALVDYEKRDHVAIITLCRPERLNAVNSEMRGELAHAWEQGIEDPEVRVFVLTGKGRIFSAGADIREIAEHGPPQTHENSASSTVFNIYGTPETGKPIVAAVVGGAWGVGWFMICGSDIAVANSDAVFAMSEVSVGHMGPPFVPIMNNLAWLPGAEIALRGQRVTAQRAYEIGLINHVVPTADEVLPFAMEIAQELGHLPPVHLQSTKEQLNLARPRLTPYQHTIARPQAGAYLSSLDDTREAAEAFLQRRKPVFRGK